MVRKRLNRTGIRSKDWKGIKEDWKGIKGMREGFIGLERDLKD